MSHVFWLLIALTVGVYSYIAGTYQPQITSSNHDVVKAICDYSHTLQGVEGAGAWEEACGLAQDESSTEYLCDKGLERCWVEDE